MKIPRKKCKPQSIYILKKNVYPVKYFVWHLCYRYILTSQASVDILSCSSLCSLSFDSLSFNSLSFNSFSFNSISFNSLSFNSFSFNSFSTLFSFSSLGSSFNSFSISDGLESVDMELDVKLLGCDDSLLWGSCELRVSDFSFDASARDEWILAVVYSIYNIICRTDWEIRFMSIIFLTGTINGNRRFSAVQNWTQITRIMHGIR